MLRSPVQWLDQLKQTSAADSDRLPCYIHYGEPPGDQPVCVIHSAVVVVSSPSAGFINVAFHSVRETFTAVMPDSCAETGKRAMCVHVHNF